VDVREQVSRLVRLQQLSESIRAARKVEQDAPGRIEQIEARFRERNAEYVAVRERYEALQSDQRLRSGALDLLEDHRAKYMNDLMQVKNQREYAAMLKEIDAVKSQISENEEAVLKDLEEIGTIEGELATHEEHIREERVLVERESAQVQTEAEQALAAIAALEQERSRLEAELPLSLVQAVRRLESGRGGVFLAKVVDGVCQSCFVRVRPQVYQEIKLGARLHSCSSCQRLLHHDRPARSASADETAASRSDAVEAVDGGAV